MNIPLLDFIDASNRAQNYEDLVLMYCGTLHQYGYSNFVYHHATKHQQPELSRIYDLQPNSSTLMNWSREYIQLNYHEADPLLKVFPRMKSLFTHEHLWQMPLNPKQKTVMQFRQDLIMQGKVLYIPLMEFGTGLHGMAIGTRDPEARMDQSALSELYALNNQFHLCHITLQNQHRLMLPDIVLSPREKEILQWCALGKSNGVIGSILSISERTVEFHLKSVFKKLDTTNRTTAALKAVNLRLISL